MFKVWNIIDCALTGTGSGHHYWEMKALTDELARRGTEARIFCHKTTSRDRFPNAQVFPIFSLFPYSGVSQDPTWSAIENFIVHNRSFDYDLSRTDQLLFRDSLALIPMLSERHLLGTVRWLGRFNDHARPKVAVLLSGLHRGSPMAASAQLYERVWRDCAPALKDGIALCVRTSREADIVQQLLGTRPHVLPSPLGPPERRNTLAGNPALPSQMTVSFMGNARREKGWALLPDVVKQCSSLDIRFFIQAKPDTSVVSDISLLTALRHLPNVQICETALTREDYHDLIANSVVLLPYDPVAYRWRHSGIYTEAKCLGAPVIVSAGTWMAEDVKSCGNGLVFEDYSAGALAESIARAQRELSILRARAANCAKDFRKQQGPDRYVDTINGLFVHGA